MPGGGPHPQDACLFAPEALPALRAAAGDLRYLRERGYALPSALKVVGDRYLLRERQRTAIARATSEAAGAAARAAGRVPDPAPPPRALGVDAFNVVITLETALNGGLLVTTVDGGLRDIAGVHGSYRLGPLTEAALGHLADRLVARGWAAAPTRWLLDAPVSNSGRLAARIREVGAARGLPWTAEVVPDPDALLAALPPGEVAASGDAVVLERAPRWVDLAAEAVRASVPGAWIVDLELDAGPSLE